MINGDIKRLKVALVIDSLLAFGGAERHLFSFLKIFPNAVIFTSVYDKKRFPTLKNEVRTSVLQRFRFLKRFLNAFTPLAFEQFNFEGFDLVISLSAGSSKGIITGVGQKHICIILTPPRHQWDRELNVRASKLKRFYSFFSVFLSHYLRLWDISAIRRVDNIVAISKFIQTKIFKTYRRESAVIYPGILPFWFETVSENEKNEVKKRFNLPEHFLLYAGRLYDHKRVDWAITACLKHNVELVIAGNGPDLKYLRKIAGRSKNIHFLGNKEFIRDVDLRAIYALADCFLFPPIEDFGYVAVESMATGTPVLAFSLGGATETVKEGITGAFFSNENELSELISKKAWIRYNTKDIKDQALRFSEDRFISEFIHYLEVTL
ncbi:glycosyltransferase [Candidatus Dojkabacteria bacterium]|jgi:glycosyltransferase involved in cell wall biosynthesis|nr:glycosyltransferase [Candidatus Dojkabacteria bacterium]